MHVVTVYDTAFHCSTVVDFLKAIFGSTGSGKRVTWAPYERFWIEDNFNRI